MASPGTFEIIALEFSKALEPIADRMRDESAMTLLAELGLELPHTAMTPALETAFRNGVASAEALPQASQDLIAAIEGGDTIQIISKGVAVIGRVTVLVASFKTIADQLGAIGPVPGLTAADLAAFVADLPKRLTETMIVEYLENEHPLILALFELLGLAEQIRHNPGSTDPLHPEFVKKSLRFDHLEKLLSSPDRLVADLYGWGTPAFDGGLLLHRLGQVLEALNIIVTTKEIPGAPPRPAIEIGLITIAPIEAAVPPPPGLEATLMLSVADGLKFEFPISEGLVAELSARGALDAAVGVRVQPPAAVTLIPPSGSVQGEVTVGVARTPVAPATTVELLGVAGGTGLTVQRLGLGFISGFKWTGAHAEGDFGFEGRLQGGKLRIAMDQADGFLAKLLSGVSLEADFDLGFGWSTGRGIYFTGSAALEIQLPTHISLGPIDIDALTLSVGIQGGTFPIGLSANMKAALGPLTVAVEQVGAVAKLSFPADHSGNLGPANVVFGFKPPKGAGLSIDAEVVLGGGYLFFDPDKGEYAGVAELAIAEIVTVKAIALIATRMPDGSSGFSLLLILTTDFPPIELGFGFTLNGVGGLLGLNRAVLLDVLRDGVRTGAVNDIVFPADVIANAPRIISDLKAVFPPQEGTFLVGPMAKFGWGTPSLVTLSLGIIIEIPPGNIAILGVLKVALPNEEDALIQIQVAFIGILDFDEKLLSFDASLYDSHVLFITLEGDMVVRLKWGDNAGFLLSVGGFHPSFNPPSGLHLPATIRRLSISILDYDWAKIKIDCYFAVTSNTVQFGAHAFLFFGVDAANISGQVGFDVLFQFSPFRFIALVSGSLSISVAGLDLLSINLHCSLEGPTPWHAKGTGSISICWFFSIDISIDVTWGEQKDTSLPPVDVMPLFLAEMNKQENWKALPPPTSNLLVSLHKVDPSLLVLHPFGSLTLSQRAVPLNLTLDKVGNEKPDDVNRVDITAVASGGVGLPISEEDEQFAIAQFQNMNDQDKLSRPSYQQVKGGVTIGSSEAMQSSKMTRRTISYSVTIIDKEPKKPLPKGKNYPAIAGLFHRFLSGASVARSVLSDQVKSQLKPFTDKISVNAEGYTVSNTADNKPFDSSSQFSSEAMARDYLQSQMLANPSLAGTLHILPSSEVNAS